MTAEPPASPGGLRVLAWPGLRARPTNPYTWLLCSHLERLGVRVREFGLLRALRGGYDVLHLHWPEKALDAESWVGSAARGVAALAILDAAHRRGARVVWTAHNANPHETRHPRLERWFWSAFVRRVDGVIHLSEAGRRAVEACYPALAARPQALVPHGHFRGAYPDTVSREQARARLGLPADARVIVFLGKVRRYKNVPHLVRIFRLLPSDTGLAILVVAGAPADPALAREVRAAGGGDPRVRLALEHVPDAAVQAYLRAADLVALPFTEITNSGSALLALSFDRPVLVPARGAMGEIRVLAGDSWVRTYDGELTPGVLAGALEWALNRPAGGSPCLEELDWPRVARLTLAAYRAAAEPAGRRLPRRRMPWIRESW